MYSPASHYHICRPTIPLIAFTQRVFLLATFLLPLALTTPLQAQSQQQQWQAEYEKTLVHVRNGNIDKWISEVQSIALRGNLIATNQLGRLYYSGSQQWGIDADPGQSFSWYKKSADRNDPVGQYAMGSFYETGTYVEQSSELAIRWYTKSALQGYEDASVQLAAIYLYGTPSEPDVSEALKWIQKVYCKYPEEENLKNPYYFLGRYFQDKQEHFYAADFYIAGRQPPSFEDLQAFEASLGEVIDTGNKADVLAMADFYRRYLGDGAGDDEGNEGSFLRAGHLLVSGRGGTGGSDCYAGRAGPGKTTG